MSARARDRRTAVAIALTAGITAGASMLLTGCGPAGGSVADRTASPSATSTGSAAPTTPATTPAGTATPTAPPTTAAKPVSVPAKLNGTAHNGLTISDGSRYVVMNGTRVDFGTEVRDLAWSPNGTKAAFVDGDGDLAVSNPDGSGRVVVVKNAGGQNLSHPTWEVRGPLPDLGLEDSMSKIVFAVRTNGVSKLVRVSSTAHHGTPELLTLQGPFESKQKPIPQTGNVWPSGGGPAGEVVFANSADGGLYVRDDVIRQQTSSLAGGSQPDLSPTDDGEIVFVRSVGGHDHLFLETPTTSGATYKDLTPHATTDYTEPAFSPDGKTIAARTPSGIVTLPANGSHAPVTVSGYVGLPAYRG